MIIGIVAVAKNFAIGKDGKLPWHHSADLKFFKQTTLGHTVVMGSNTYRSIGKPLPGRMNIVLTRNKDFEVGAGVKVLTSVDQVIEAARNTPGDLFIIGGAKVYESLAHVIDQWIVTYVPDKVEDADTFLQEDFLDGFNEVDRKELDGGLLVRIMQRVL